MIPRTSISLCNAYDFGGESLQYLAQALRAFEDMGGDRVKEALHSNEGIRLLAPDSTSGQLSVKDSLLRLTATSFGLWHFRLSYIVISPTEMQSCRAYPSGSPIATLGGTAGGTLLRIECDILFHDHPRYTRSQRTRFMCSSSKIPYELPDVTPLMPLSLP